jgi:hypothetical protein
VRWRGSLHAGGEVPLVASPPPPLLLNSSGKNLGVWCQRRRAWSGMAEVECGWQSGWPGGPSSSPLPPSSLLSCDGKVNGINDESTTAMSGPGGVVAGVHVVGSALG